MVYTSSVYSNVYQRLSSIVLGDQFCDNVTSVWAPGVVGSSTNFSSNVPHTDRTEPSPSPSASSAETSSTTATPSETSSSSTTASPTQSPMVHPAANTSSNLMWLMCVWVGIVRTTAVPLPPLTPHPLFSTACCCCSLCPASCGRARMPPSPSRTCVSRLSLGLRNQPRMSNRSRKSM